jgi:hypothetical protein
MLDKFNMFTAITGQAITDDAASTDHLDLGVDSPKSDVGPGTPIFVDIFLKTAFGSTAETLEIQLEHAADDGAGSPDTWTDKMILLPATEADTISVGRIVRVPLPTDMWRYIRLYFNVSATLADGVVVAGLNLD